ncbi:LytTR family DNA-binding domain-containing protein [Maricaulis sp. W15]|nr:LytTR family DNA-binding domain-containing protein [Maricaulis sp. W15]
MAPASPLAAPSVQAGWHPPALGGILRLLPPDRDANLVSPMQYGKAVFACACVSLLFAVIFVEQGVDNSGTDGGYLIFVFWFAALFYSAILFLAARNLIARLTARLNWPRAVTVALACAAAIVSVLPAASLMTVSLDSFHHDADLISNRVPGQTAVDFLEIWLGELLDITPTATIFLLSVFGATVLLGGVTLLPSRPVVGSAGPDVESSRCDDAGRMANLIDRTIWALQADEHYVLVHGPNGTRQSLGRLRDAIAAVEGVPGLQVHRSWWVARDGIEAVDDDPRQVRIRLRSGQHVPVSQRRLKAFRDWRGVQSDPS